MGLTISYTLSSDRALSEETVRRLVEHTAQFAQRIGCAAVQMPMPGGPEHWKLWTLPDGATTGEPVSAIGGWSVTVLPGEGCEPAQFGLCRYPGIERWQLTSWCKTQYAARHGIEHFIVCHRRVISLLDLWRSLPAAAGVHVQVSDEADFWQTRSMERLRERLRTYDRLVAAVAGALKDGADAGGPGVQAEIFDDARFERLEAEGRAEFAAQLEQALQIIRSDAG